MTKVYIAIAYGDRLDAVQWAESVEHAKELVKNVMPPLKQGYSYKIINQ